MDTKKWLGIVIVVVFALAFVWLKSASQPWAPGIQTVSAGSNVPAPGTGQKKVVLKNLGMA